ncbi:MAG: glycoside hydrolase family protein [Segetibacter sp.]|nr:glycoside hydrolase family protein [Segetibacter sp.]
MPGSHPDPSVVKVGDTYWASATTSNWFPIFPLLYSKDMVHWKQKGYIFNKVPAWADYYFWAPELTYDSGKIYVYYTAHKKGGNLCVAVATADKPEGPYTDLGPLVCQPAGSIDGFPVRDTTGKLYLIWKEDANSVGNPTPIWASEMNEERTALIGEKIELFRNEAAWEKELVEGVSIIRHGEYFYAFYAAAGCCGTGCSYVSGVARSKVLLGPWEKFNKNPILTDTKKWICRGHGTPIEKDGRFYFLYHGYDKKTNAFTGREGLLEEFKFTEDGWIEFIKTPSGSVPRSGIIIDDFNGQLESHWQSGIFHQPEYLVRGGQIELKALPGPTGSFLVQKPFSSDYTANAIVMAKQSDAITGLAAIGDQKNMLSVLLKADQLLVVEVKNGKEKTLIVEEIAIKEKVYLQMRVRDRFRISFSYSIDGENFINLNDTAISGAFLPPWDNPFRIGLVSIGSAEQKAVYERFEMHDVLHPSLEVIGETAWRRTLKIISITLLVACLIILAFFWWKKGKKLKTLFVKEKRRQTRSLVAENK